MRVRLGGGMLTVGVVVVLLAVVVLLSSCGSLAPTPEPSEEGAHGNGTGGGSDSELPGSTTNGQFTFTQYFYGNWASNYLWKDQYAMKLITEKTGVRIDRQLARGSDDEYLNTMIATGNLPDTLMLDWDHQAVTKLIDSGLVYSMNELIDQYAPEFWDNLDPEMVQYHSIDGQLWYLPNMYEPKERMTSGKPIVSIRPWFMRRDIYEELGRPRIETTEDMKRILGEIKERYPDLSSLGLDFFDVAKNGFSSSLSMDYLIYSFAPYLLEERIRDDRQEVLYPMRHPGFIDAFRYLNSLYREGIFDSKFLITKQEQYEEAMYRGEFAVASQFLNGMYTQFNPTIKATLGEDKTYVVLDGLRVGDQEPRYPASRLLGWQGFFITKMARDPEKIIHFAEYAWSDEGQMDFLFGKEGETYEMVNGLPRYTPEVRELMNEDYRAWQMKYGFEASTLLWRAGELWDKSSLREMILSRPDEYNAAVKLSRFNYDDYGLGMGNLEPDGSSPEGVINAKIKDLWNKAIPRLVMASSDEEFDQMYAEFIALMDDTGAQRVEKEMYRRHLEDLKKKGIE